jgi:hypothetical protein
VEQFFRLEFLFLAACPELLPKDSRKKKTGSLKSNLKENY